MKFTTLFFTVLTATTTLAVPSFKDCDSISEKKYLDCVAIQSSSSFNEKLCIDYESKVCQEFYNTNIKDILAKIPECKNRLNEKEMIEFEKRKKAYNYTMSNLCAKDEQGNYCPYSPGNIQNSSKYKDKTYLSLEEFNAEYSKLIKESCNSKKCVDQYINLIDNALKESSDIDYNKLRNDNLDILEIYSILKSETCAARYNKTNGNGNDKIDTSSVNTSTVNANNGTANGNTNVSNGTTNGNANVSNVISNGKTDTSSNNNNNGKTDATSGAIRVTYSNVLFAGLAILLSILL